VRRPTTTGRAITTHSQSRTDGAAHGHCPCVRVRIPRCAARTRSLPPSLAPSFSTCLRETRRAASWQPSAATAESMHVVSGAGARRLFVNTVCKYLAVNHGVIVPIRVTSPTLNCQWRPATHFSVGREALVVGSVSPCCSVIPCPAVGSSAASRRLDPNPTEPWHGQSSFHSPTDMATVTHVGHEGSNLPGEAGYLGKR